MQSGDFGLRSSRKRQRERIPYATMDDFELDSLIAEIEAEPKKPSAGQGGAAPVTAELDMDDIDAFMADLNVGGAASRAQTTKKPVIKRTNKYTSVGAAAGNELDSLLENLDPKTVDLNEYSKGTCDFCHNIIIGDFVNCMNKYFHPEHIYCQNCKKRDPNNRYFEKDRQVVCSSCQIQKAGVYCKGCGQGILGMSIDALDAKWHPECFTCGRCRKPFEDGKYAMREGKPHCQACAAVTQYCRSCKKLIDGLAVSALGGYFHKEGNCFACQTCFKPVGPGFCQDEGVPYCEMHFLEKKGVPICAHCTRPISGPFMSALGKKYHADHFICTLCMKPLGSNFIEDHGKPYCHDCAKAI